MKHTIWLAVVLGCGIAGPGLAQCEPKKLLASNGGKLGRFGWSVAVHERIAAISGSKDRVYVFDLRTGLERFRVTKADAPGSSAEFGWSVDINEKWLIVGAPGMLFAEGSASVFDLSTGLEVHQFRASNANWCDWFGWSVALDGDIALIGAPGVTGCGIEGRAFVFDLTTGQELLELTVPGNVYLGTEVDIDGDRGILADFYRVHLFNLTTGKRILEFIPSAGAFDWTAEVAIEGNLAVVGDHGDSTLGSGAGAAFVFDTTSGQELFKLLGSNWKAGANFGTVALHGDRVLVGTHQAVNKAKFASLFDVRSGLEIATVTAPGVEPQDGFGGSLALGADWMLIGALNDDELGDYAGAAFLYQLRSSPAVSSYCGPANLNSTGQSASASAASKPLFCDKLYLLAEYLPPHQVGYFLTSTTQGFTPFAGGSQGNLCLGGSIGRFSDQVRNSGPNGAFRVVADTSALPQPSGDVAVQLGETWNFQAWYRDQNPGPTSNFTDAVSVLFK